MTDQTLDILHPSTSLEWEEWPSLPVKMSDAFSVYLNGTLYVGGGLTENEPGCRAEASLYSFTPGVDTTWTVTDTPTYWYTLVAHDSELLLVGGYEYPTEEITNKVFKMRDGEFVEALPPMKERRESPSAVSSGCALVVAGGEDTSGALSSVEVFKDGQWTTAPSLPSADYDVMSALHGDQWYLITCLGKVFRTSLQSLISGFDQSPWETLPDVPNSWSAAAFCSGRLLSIGGGDDRNPTTAISAFSSTTSTQLWEHVTDMPVSLTRSSAVVLPTEELLVIGGRDIHGNCSDKVIRAILKVSLDVQFSIPKLHQLHKYGINLMEVLSKDQYRFHITSGVQLLVKDRKKAPTLSPSDYIELIFNAWERSKRPTYPPTWEGLFTVLRKMDLGHLAEQIAKCVTGSLPEIEDSPLPSESEVQLSPGDKEQATAGGESSVTELRYEVKRQLLEHECLQEELDQLTDEYDEQADKIHQLEKDNQHLRNENHHLRAESKGLVPVKQELNVEPEHSSQLPLITGVKREAIKYTEQGSSNKRPRIDDSSEDTSTLMQETKAEPQITDDLPGVEVVASTCVIVTNSPQIFHWVGYGFKLTIPQGSLPAGVDQCRLEIKASVAGQYQFPGNLQLVSGVFWIRPLPLCQFQQQLTVEIQHCAKMTSSTKLSFVRACCSKKYLPYTFEVVDSHASFSEHSSYGVLEINHFSGFGIETTDEVTERRYIASLYYYEENALMSRIHIVVTSNTDIHRKAVDQQYTTKRAVSEQYLPLEFETGKISLDIKDAVISSGWEIKAPTPLQYITKSEVDDFTGNGQWIPALQLQANRLEKKAKLECTLKLNGVIRPTELNISIPYSNDFDKDSQGSSSKRERDENQLCIDDLQDVISSLINAEKHWFYLGLALHVKPGTLEGIKSKESCNTDRLCEMLTHWLRSSPSRTWSDIYNGLRSDTVKQDVLADTIEDKHKQGLSRKKRKSS